MIVIVPLLAPEQETFVEEELVIAISQELQEAKQVRESIWACICVRLPAAQSVAFIAITADIIVTLVVAN